jgi:hypothetical protein
MLKRKGPGKKTYEDSLLRASIIENKKTSHLAHVTETNTTEFDPITGKKILHTKTVDSQHNITEHTQTKHSIEQLIAKRCEQLSDLDQMLDHEAKTKSEFFTPFVNQVTQTLRLLEQCRQQLKLSYDETSDHCLWRDSTVVSMFLFGKPEMVIEDLHGFWTYLMEESSELLTSCVLASLWSWSEMVQFGLKLKNNCCISPRMISHYIFGCLLREHIPNLKKLMRHEIIEHCSDSISFPQFQELHVPAAFSEEDPVLAMFRYDFRVQMPPIPHLPYDSPSCSGVVGIGMDGPLARLISKSYPELSELILNTFKQRSLRLQYYA